MLDTLAEINERHEAVKELEKSLMELHQVFLDMAVLVEAQGEMLDNIEQQVTVLPYTCFPCAHALLQDLPPLCLVPGQIVPHLSAQAVHQFRIIQNSQYLKSSGKFISMQVRQQQTAPVCTVKAAGSVSICNLQSVVSLFDLPCPSPTQHTPFCVLTICLTAILP